MYQQKCLVEQKNRSDSRDSNQYRSPLTGSRRNNNVSISEEPNQPNEQKTALNSNNQQI